MRHRLAVLVLLSLAACGGVACGGGPGTGTSGGEAGSAGAGLGGAGAGGATGPSAGGEVAGETDGFDMAGFEDTGPTSNNGTASALELIGIHPPPTPWASMSFDERSYYMVAAVQPIAAEQFRNHDPERYATFECTTCHGDDAEAEQYEMPSRGLPRLAAPGTAAWDRMAATPAYAFMHDTVTPTVAAQLGEPVFDPATGEGFGCFECHMRRGD